MQKFTRTLTREVEVGGERVAVTLDESGVAFRTVGTRRPPLTISWMGIVCAAAGAPYQVDEAVKALKKGGEKSATSEPEPVEPAASEPAAATPASEPGVTTPAPAPESAPAATEAPSPVPTM